MSAETIEIVGSADRLHALAVDWWDLWARSESATPFQSPAWLLAWWRAFHPGALATIAVWRSGGLVALAPLYLSDDEHGRRLMPVGIGISDYLDLIADDRPALDALATGAAQVAGWRRWELEELAPGAVAHGVGVPSGCDLDEADQSTCLVVPLGTPAAERLRPSARRHLNLARNRARRAGLDLRRLGSADAAAFLAELVRLHEARWTARGEAGVLADPRVRSFHGDVAPELAGRGLARFYLAVEGGAAVAALLVLAGRDRAMAYLSGLDPEEAHASPGRLLLDRAVEDAAEEGLGEFHFLRGREPYKFEWRAEERRNRRRSFVRRAAPDEARP